MQATVAILYEGFPSNNQFINGKLRDKVIPFVGAEHVGNTVRMGAGVIYCQTTNDISSTEQIIYVVFNPPSIIRAWETMKLLEALNHVDFKIIRMCWNIISDQTTKALPPQELIAAAGGHETLKLLLDRVLSTPPSRNDLESMIQNMANKRIPVDSSVILRDHHLEGISLSSTTNTLLRSLDPNYRNQNTRSLLQTTSKQKDLYVFLHWCGVHDLVTKNHHETFWDPWRQIKLKDIDVVVLHDCLTEATAWKHDLKCKGAFGRVNPPIVIGHDSTKYVLNSVRLHAKNFLIHVTIYWKELMTVEREYTIPELFDRIGKPAQQSWLQKLLAS